MIFFKFVYKHVNFKPLIFFIMRVFAIYDTEYNKGVK